MMDKKLLLRLAYISATQGQSSWMTTNEIKAFFIRRHGMSLSAVALSIGEDRSAVSRVVNYERPGPRIRRKLKTKFPGLRFKKWGKEADHQRAA